MGLYRGEAYRWNRLKRLKNYLLHRLPLLDQVRPGQCPEFQRESVINLYWKWLFDGYRVDKCDCFEHV